MDPSKWHNPGTLECVDDKKDCADGEWWDATDNMCEPCMTECATCIVASRCESCVDPTKWLNPGSG